MSMVFKVLYDSNSLPGHAKAIEQACLASPKNRRFIVKQIKRFRKLRDYFKQELTKAKDAARDDGNLQYYGDDDPEKTKAKKCLFEKGMIIEKHYLLEIKGRKVQFWRYDELPFNPDGYLANFRANFRAKIFPDNPPKEDRPSDGDALACHCALWAAIHDYELELSAKLCAPDDDWAEWVWRGVIEEPSLAEYNEYSERMNKLKMTFREVVNKLPVKIQLQERPLPEAPAEKPIIVIRESVGTTSEARPDEGGQNVQAEAATGKPNVELNLAERTLTVGEDTQYISGESVWNLLKTLVDNKKLSRITPRHDGKINWKNAVDTLRRMVGKDNLRYIVDSSRDGYWLVQGVRIKGGGQIGIKKTKLGPPK